MIRSSPRCAWMRSPSCCMPICSLPHLWSLASPRGSIMNMSGEGRNLFVMVEPLVGWRHVEVTAQRTSAATMPKSCAGWSILSLRRPSISGSCRTSLHTHTPASLYETFPPARAASYSATRRVPLYPQARQGARIWPKLRLPFWSAMPSLDAWKAKRYCVGRSRRSNANVTSSDVALSGSSRGRDARLKLERLYPVPTNASHSPPG
jgi:hypothetical protein